MFERLQVSPDRSIGMVSTSCSQQSGGLTGASVTIARSLVIREADLLDEWTGGRWRTCLVPGSSSLSRRGYPAIRGV